MCEELRVVRTVLTSEWLSEGVVWIGTDVRVLSRLYPLPSGNEIDCIGTASSGNGRKVSNRIEQKIGHCWLEVSHDPRVIVLEVQHAGCRTRSRDRKPVRQCTLH